MSLTRVRYADLVALPSLDEIKARKAARNTAPQADAPAPPGIPPCSEGTGNTPEPPQTPTEPINLPTPGDTNPTTPGVDGSTTPGVVDIQANYPASREAKSETSASFTGISPAGSIATRIPSPTALTTPGDLAITTPGVANRETPGVVKPSTPGVVNPSSWLEGMWTGESLGGIFPSSRLREIKLAQDALNHPEEAVYDLLWKEGQPWEERDRTITIGYDRIARSARVTKRNALAIMSRLETKGFVLILRPADSIRNIGTTYIVFSYRTVLSNQQRCGRRWVLRIGAGVDYARRFTPDVATTATPGVFGLTTPGDADLATPGTATITPPVVATVTTPGVATTPLLVHRDLDQQEYTSSSSEFLLEATADFDDDARYQLIKNCRKTASDVSADEIAYATRSKRMQLSRRRIDNPVGFLLEAVPKSLAGSGLSRIRDQMAQAERQEAGTAARQLALQAELERELDLQQRTDIAWLALAEEDRIRRLAAAEQELKTYPSWNRVLKHDDKVRQQQAEVRAKATLKTELEEQKTIHA